MKITGKTSVLGIIGDPIAHSLSPLMQNAAIKACGLDYIYVPFHVQVSNLAEAVSGLKSLGVAGFNVTVPHKEAIIKYLDRIDPHAVRVGAVNTVKNDGGILIGYNTDSYGFISSLHQELGFDPSGKKIIIIGSGGAARAAAAAVAEAGAADILIANRNIERAKSVASTVKDYYMNVDIQTKGLEILSDIELLNQFHLIVNSSSVGLYGDRFESFSPSLPLLGYDMVYRDKPTHFIESITNAGGRGANGQGMLAGQGEMAFELWTGSAPPRGLMLDVLLNNSIKAKL